MVGRLAFRAGGGGVHRNRTTSGGGRAASAWVRIERSTRMVSAPPRCPVLRTPPRRASDAARSVRLNRERPHHLRVFPRPLMQVDDQLRRHRHVVEGSRSCGSRRGRGDGHPALPFPRTESCMGLNWHPLRRRPAGRVRDLVGFSFGIGGSSWRSGAPQRVASPPDPTRKNTNPASIDDARGVRTFGCDLLDRRSDPFRLSSSSPRPRASRSVRR